MYLLRSGRYVKIGRTKNLLGRFRDFSVSNPSVTLVGFFRHDRHVELERYLHHRLRAYWYRGEWFELDDAQVCDVERLVARATPGELDACSVRSERRDMSDPIDLGGGKWKIRVYLGRDADGKQVRRAKTYEAGGIRAARTMAHQVEAEVRAEYAESTSEIQRPTVATAARNWWELWLGRNRSPTTREGYDGIIERHILDAPFAHLRVGEVTTGQIERWYSALATGGKVREVTRTVRRRVEYSGRAKRPTNTELRAMPAGSLAGVPRAAGAALRRFGLETVYDVAKADLSEVPGLTEKTTRIIKEAVAEAKRAPERPTWEWVEETTKVADPPLSPSTVRRIHAVLTQVFDQCVRDELLERNPAVLAYKPESRPQPKTHTPIGTVRAVLEAAHGRSPVRSRALAFAALTGLRRGEMCGIRWSALDVEQGILIIGEKGNVVSAQQRFVDPTSDSRETVLHVKDPKAHQAAAIALGSQATALVVQQVEWQSARGAEMDVDPFLWSWEPPYTTSLHPDTMSHWFSRAAKDAGVTGVSLHDLRHWQGSQVLEVGGTVQDVKERLRHKSLQTTMGYLHADHSKQRVLVDLLPRLELPSGA